MQMQPWLLACLKMRRMLFLLYHSRRRKPVSKSEFITAYLSVCRLMFVISNNNNRNTIIRFLHVDFTVYSLQQHLLQALWQVYWQLASLIWHIYNTCLILYCSVCLGQKEKDVSILFPLIHCVKFSLLLVYGTEERLLSELASINNHLAAQNELFNQLSVSSQRLVAYKEAEFGWVQWVI